MAAGAQQGTKEHHKIEKLLTTEDRRETALNERRPRQPRELRHSAKDAAQKALAQGHQQTKKDKHGFRQCKPETL